MKDYIEAQFSEKDSTTTIEVVENTVAEVEPISAVENLVKISGYNDLVIQISKLGIDGAVGMGDAKAYDWSLGQSIWKETIEFAKPIVNPTEYEMDKLVSVYKFMYQCTRKGEYPLVQLLANYLGLSLDTFFTIIKDPSHPNQRVYEWAYNVIDAASAMNSVKSNGNISVRKWLDQSREHRVTADVALQVSHGRDRLDTLQDLGKELAKSLREEIMDE